MTSRIKFASTPDTLMLRISAIVVISLGLMAVAVVQASPADAVARYQEEVDQPESPLTQTSVPTTSPLPSPTATPSGIPADWKDYQDSELGFSFRYPEDMALEKYAGPGTAKGGTEEYVRLTSHDDPGRIILIALISNDEGLSLDRWVQGATACLPETVHNVIVASEQAIACTNQPEEIKESALILEHDGVIFFITATVSASEFGSLISSFEL